MSFWKGIIGRNFVPDDFQRYVETLSFTGWRPRFVVLHNTSSPRLSEWHNVPGNERMRNLESYYRNPDPETGKPSWSAGPHLFVADDFIWVFTPLTTSGIHSPSWNGVSWGVEMVGEYNEEPFGPRVRDNTVDALAILHAWRGLDPDTLRFHKEDPKTSHRDCPGRHVDKEDVIGRVHERMAQVHAGEHVLTFSNVPLTSVAERPAQPVEDSRAASFASASLLRSGGTGSDMLAGRLGANMLPQSVPAPPTGFAFARTVPAVTAKPSILDKGAPVAHLRERVGKHLTDVPVYKLADKPGYFFKANMAIDVDGSPRAYFPGNRNPEALDLVDDADGEGSSTTYVQGELRNGQIGKGPRPGFYVSGTSLRVSPPWDTDSFVDAEQIPYVVFPPDFKDVQLGDMAVVVDLRSWRWTHAIFADTNAHVGEASLRVARNLGLEHLTARNGDDEDNYAYLLFPRTAFAPAPTAPHWPDANIRDIAGAQFSNWGGIEQMKRCFQPTASSTPPDLASQPRRETSISTAPANA